MNIKLFFFLIKATWCIHWIGFRMSLFYFDDEIYIQNNEYDGLILGYQS